MIRDIKVRGVAVLDGKLLCVQLKPYPGSAHDGKNFWCLPGGTVDEGEHILEALQREMIEELGVEPELGRLLYVQQFTHGGRDFTEFFVHIKNAHDYVTLDLASTSHGSIEIEKVDFVDPKQSVVMPAFLATDDLEALIASAEPVRFFAQY